VKVPLLFISPNIKKTLKASGLIEVMIAMTIFAVAVITITSMNANNYRTVKDNELEDLANQQMIKAMEFFKSPTTGNAANSLQRILILDIPNIGNIACYTIITPIDATQTTLSILLRGNTLAACAKITSCNTTPNYDLQFGTNSNAFPICNQIIVVKKSYGYEVTSRIAYKLGIKQPPAGTHFVNELIGFRLFTY
jgi:hypothetical protein